MLLALMAAGPAAAQQAYPGKPVRIIVPLAAGGGTDVLARVIAGKFRTMFDQPVTVENRSGAAGNIGAEYVFRAPADGHTLLFTQPAPLTVNKALYGKLPFEPEQFMPIAIASLQDIMLAVHPDVPVRDLRELIAYAKANPGRLNFGSSGAGSAPHLAAEMFKAMAGVEMVHVPYKGSAESVSATIGGQVQLTFFAFSSALPHAKAGKLRAIGVGGAQRNAALPDVPAIAEVLPGYLATSWTALVAPPGTPQPVVDTLARATAEALRQEDVRQRILESGDSLHDGTPAQVADYMRQETRRWSALIRRAGISVQ